MKKTLRHLGIAFAAILACGSGVSLMANAESLSQTVTSNFTGNWTKTVSGNSGSKLEYGYNSVLINEDVAYAYHPSASHYAKISNGRGGHTSRSSFGGQWSNLEVMHSGQTVVYACEW
ncbi:MAG: hypothetical protein IJ085_05295 [Turicibacter sp.]|nr:hypothetical protein [Turicibacter sp.]